MPKGKVIMHIDDGELRLGPPPTSANGTWNYQPLMFPPPLAEAGRMIHEQSRRSRLWPLTQMRDLPP